MGLLSATSGRIAASPTIAMSNLALALRAEGRDVIALAAGEPDFDTPLHVRDAAKAAIDAGHTRYTAVDGTPELKSAVRGKFARENGIDYAPDEVIVSAGGKHVLYNAMVATLDPGDEVIIPAPYWTSYPDMARLAGGEAVIVPTRMEDGFRLTPDALAAGLTDRTKWVVLNSPGNPTGAGYRAADLARLAEVIRTRPDVHVLSDDIYEPIVYPGFDFATMAAVAPDLKDRTLTVNGVSKAHAMTGWRIGYAGGPASLIGAMRKVQSQSTTNPCSISQWAATAALDGPQDHLADWRAAFLRRRDLVVGALDALPGVDCPVPDGAFYVFARIEGCLGGTSAAGTRIATSEVFARALLAETGVATVFGEAFGAPGHLRLSYAASDAALAEALDRIRAFVGGLT